MPSFTDAKKYRTARQHLRRGWHLAIITFWAASPLACRRPHSAESSEPTQPEPSAQTARVDRELDEKFNDWKRSLTPARRAWEETLEANLGPHYLPIHKQDKIAGVSDAWDFVADDPTLPRVLLIGDSISRGYTLSVRSALAGRANVHRAPENCSTTANGLRKLELYLGSEKWDVIHFNFGIHDRLTPVETYERNLELITARLKATGAQLIWASSTPVSSQIRFSNLLSRDSLRHFVRGDAIIIRNSIAARIADREGIRINDLHTYVLPKLADLRKRDGIHFYDAGYEYLALKVAQEIEAVLNQRSRPLTVQRH